MRRFFFLAIAICLVSISPAFAAQFGPAQAQVKPGQFALGVGVFHYSDRWDIGSIGSYGSSTTDAEQTQAFIQVELGLFPTWETYVRLGGANLKVNRALGGAEFEDEDFEPFATVGLKGILLRGKYMDVGGFVEGSYFHEYTDETSTTLVVIDEAAEVNAGLTFQKEIEGALLYGGPFFHFREGDFWLASKTLGSGSSTYEETANLGAFLGIRWVGFDDIVVEAELQLRNNLSAGAALSFLF
ncbi:MAG: hypothetical protein WDA20_05125 [Desulfuromonadales bacterium]